MHVNVLTDIHSSVGFSHLFDLNSFLDAFKRGRGNVIDSWTLPLTVLRLYGWTVLCNIRSLAVGLIWFKFLYSGRSLRHVGHLCLGQLFNLCSCVFHDLKRDVRSHSWSCVSVAASWPLLFEWPTSLIYPLSGPSRNKSPLSCRFYQRGWATV